MKQIFTLALTLFSISLFAQAPETYSMGADPIGSHNFNLYGAINGYGENTAFSFVYSTDANFTTSTTTPVQNKVINSPEVVWATINGLAANTTFYYFLTATTTNGTRNSDSLSFFSDSTVYLFANTGADVYGSYAELHGKVNGFQSTYNLSFEYGFSPETMDTALVSDFPTVLDAGTHFFRGYPNGLIADTLYFYHIKAANSSDTIYSDTRAFYTGTPYTTFESPAATNITDVSADLHLNVQGFPVPVKVKSEIDGGSISHWHTPLEYFGFTTSLINYTFSATGLEAEQTYSVRLKADTWVGNYYVESTVTTINTGIEDENNQNNNVLVYPNPARENFTIELMNELDEVSTIQLFNLNGQLVKEITIPSHQNRISINVANVETGLYLLKLVSEDTIYNKKINIIK